MNKERSIDSERYYFPELDGLRFIAFLLVFISHNELFAAMPHFTILQREGWFGVDLFFVLSAYLFTKLLLIEYQKNSTISFKKFYLRRIFRIWPIYYLIIGISILYYLFYQHLTIYKHVWAQILALLSFTDNIGDAIFGHYNHLPFAGHLWTIGYEEQFYVVIPIAILLLAKASRKTRIISFLTVLLLFNLIRLYFIYEQIAHPAIYVLPITHFEAILMGIVIGFGGLDFLLKRFHPLLLFSLGLICFIGIHITPYVAIISNWLMLTYTLVGLSATFILYAVLNSAFLKSILSIKPLMFLGKRSYGLYIYHKFAILLAEKITERFGNIPSDNLSIFIYALFLSIVFALISYKLIETPFLKWKKKFEMVRSRPI